MSRGLVLRMGIKTIYVINNTHTDVGYTDHQHQTLKQQLDYIDQALDLCDQTTDYPPEAQFKWTCEVASTVNTYLRNRPPTQIERFLHLHQQGRIAIGAMAYHWTPLLSPLGMIHSLRFIGRLRDEYGLSVTAAMQNDVNGVSWLWADLLPSIGINGLLMGINPYHGVRPQPDLRGFWWEGPGGGRLLTFHGPHYAVGIARYGIGNRHKAEVVIPKLIESLEQDGYPYDFLFAQATHPAWVDNGPPYVRLPDFVREWNEAGCSPRMILTTLDEFMRLLQQQCGTSAPVHRGDWTDWWADGPASSAYETGLNRRTEQLLPVLELLCAQTQAGSPLVEQAYELISLFDEHTWGFYASVSDPDAPLTKALWNQKASYAYEGYVAAHTALADTARQLASDLTGVQPEGDNPRPWLAPLGIDQETHRFLVVNPTPWPYRVRIPMPVEPEKPRPHAMLASLFAMDHSRSFEGDLPAIAEMYLQADLPPYGYEVVSYTKGDEGSLLISGTNSDDLRIDVGVLENAWYRLEVDPQTGGLLSWYDKELERELVCQENQWRFGQYVRESISSPQGRHALFEPDFTLSDYGTRHTTTPFVREAAQVGSVGAPCITTLEASIAIHQEVGGTHGVTTRYVLPRHSKALQVEVLVDKLPEIEPEAAYVMFPLALREPTIRLDLNGVLLEPEREQLPGSCRDYYSLQTHATVSDDQITVVFVPVEAPLLQIGGITTGRWAQMLTAERGTLASWVLNNYWDTNFRAAQSGQLVFRYHLASYADQDTALGASFADQAIIPPIVVGVSGAEVGLQGKFLSVEPEGKARVYLKPARDGRGLIVQAFNLLNKAGEVVVTFPQHIIREAYACTPLEETREPLKIIEQGIALSLPSRSVACARVLLDRCETAHAD